MVPICWPRTGSANAQDHAGRVRPRFAFEPAAGCATPATAPSDAVRRGAVRDAGVGQFDTKSIRAWRSPGGAQAGADSACAKHRTRPAPRDSGCRPSPSSRRRVRRCYPRRDARTRPYRTRISAPAQSTPMAKPARLRRCPVRGCWTSPGTASDAALKDIDGRDIDATRLHRRDAAVAVRALQVGAWPGARSRCSRQYQSLASIGARRSARAPTPRARNATSASQACSARLGYAVEDNYQGNPGADRLPRPDADDTARARPRTRAASA